jgi:hypothetical protein
MNYFNLNNTTKQVVRPAEPPIVMCSVAVDEKEFPFGNAGHAPSHK